MSFQEQKFPIVLGSVTAILTGALVWWGMQSGNRYNEAQTAYNSAVSDIGKVNKWKTPPTDENRRGKEKAVADFAKGVEELQTAFDPYRAAELESIDPTAFSDRLLEATKRVTAKFEQAGTALPPGFYLGFARYTDQLPKGNQTGLLGYELAASEEMFGLLAEAGPSQLLNVYRRPLPEEADREEDLKGKAYRTHSFEVTFSGREKVLREFLSSLANSESHYYVVRTMRVKNERESAPNASDAKFEQPASADAGANESPFGGGGFVFPGEEGSDDAAADEPAAEVTPDEPKDTGEILKQVLGSEDARVFLRIDVLQFLGSKELPKG
ncbi:hypothetical protein HNR46_002133 [Haloferula luteola]|uniref:Uncharacterized protein n=1 Tax=Haloferula luteola TaxID=595692 RepID=A0A840V8H5_9BACT|nr:Amuc_1100 family pilus-like protein [Haloferula luteola]MBB5351894.1 hypothetical protein [Haloferula luteola]